MSLRLIWIIIGMVATVALAATETITDIPRWAAILGYVGLGLVCAVLTIPLSGMSKSIRRATPDARRIIAGLIRAAIFGHVVLLVAISLRPEWWLWWPLAILGWAAVE